MRDVVAIKEGGDLDLNCPIVVHNEDMIISWTCDDEPANIRSSRIHVTDSGKLRIHSAKVGDSCNYRCEAADGFGTLSVVIKVIIVDRRLVDEMTKRANASMSDAQSRHKSPADLQQPVAHQQQKTTSSHPKSQLDNGLDIEMHIEPSQLQVNKNRSFSLECRIRHDPNPVPPQIIWLKEYIGAPIDSLDEAIDKNLLAIDGVYYHSLNWPRTSYVQKSSIASSALLVKQANYVHSGRYACFAGYPASIMNLHFNNSISNSSTATATSTDPNNTPRPSMRYKIAQALVKVDDKEGELNYKSSINYISKAEPSRDPHKPGNILVNVVSSNTWIRNLTVILLVFCISLTMFKFIGTRKRNGTAKSLQIDSDAPTSNDCNPQNQQPDLPDSQQPVATLTIPADYLSELQQDRFNLSHVPANSLMNDSNTLGERYEIDQALLNERLNGIDSTNSYSNNDHVYSEIGYQITSNITEEPYYKKPNRLNKQ